MKRTHIPLLAALGLLAGAARAQDTKTIAVTVSNTLSHARPNAPVVLDVTDLKKAAPDFDPANFVVTVMEPEPVFSSRSPRSRTLASQADDLDGDGTQDEIAFEVDLPPLSRRTVVIVYGKPEDVAPLRVQFPKKAHASFQPKYEGMGWESERVGWRMYFDERNAFDMWGKKQHAMLLDYFALPGVDYHSESPLGRDTYKIGDALGIGSPGAYVDGKTYKVSKVDSRAWKVIADGPVRAIADLIYKGWDVNGRKVDLTSRLTVWAGQHWFDHHITAKNADGLTLVTGLPVKPAKDVLFASLLQAIGQGKARAITTWGKQVLEPGATSTESLPDRNMGLGIIVVEDRGSAKAGLDDPANHLFGVPVTNAGTGTVTAWWRVVSAWDEEGPDGDSVAGLDPALQLPYAVQSQKAWNNYVSALAADAANPVVAEIGKWPAAPNASAN